MTAEMLVPERHGLVLGGGGLTGTGWLIGVPAGLLDEGALSEDAHAAAIADDRMDPRFLAPTAKAGYAQGPAAAEDVAKVWSGVSP